MTRLLVEGNRRDQEDRDAARPKGRQGAPPRERQPTSARISGDPLRLRQTLVNLVDNAIKLTEKGEVVLRLEAGTPVAGAFPLRIGVRDSGMASRPRNPR
jgi:signal transduction histidine kinase